MLRIFLVSRKQFSPDHSAVDEHRVRTKLSGDGSERRALGQESCGMGLPAGCPGATSMTLPVGSLINAAVIVAGGFIGMLLGNRLPERVRLIVFQGLGLCTLAIGIQMTFKTANPLYMVGSILTGVIIGELIRLEDRITSGGEAVKRLLRSGNARFTEGLVAATLLFCIGSMAIIGPLEEGLNGDRTIVLTKSMLDFFAAIALGAAFGSGVMFSFLPLLLYQGSITLFADTLRPYVSEFIKAELTAVGGVMILGIGINMLEIKKIRLSNLLPGLVVIIIICLTVEYFQAV
jgi:uncharacterized membrane protein YqgA involved in biofilm formation